jgi:hypothetical protein
MLSVCLLYLLLKWPKQTLFTREGTADSHKKHCEIQILSSSRFSGRVLRSRVGDREGGKVHSLPEKMAQVLEKGFSWYISCKLLCMLSTQGRHLYPGTEPQV